MLANTQPRAPETNDKALAAGLVAVVAIIWTMLPLSYLIVIVGFIPLGLAFVIRQPFFLVIMFVIFSFFRIHEAFPFLYSLKIPLLLSLCSITTLFWHVAISQKIKIYWRPELSVAAIFFALTSIGVVLASNRGIAIAYFSSVYWKIILMMFAITWLTRSHASFIVCARLVVLFGSLVGLVALYNKSAGIGLVEGTRVTIGRQIGSVLGDPNDLALVLMFPMAFALGMALTANLGRLTRSLGFIAVPILFFAVLATQSRGGLLGILAVMGVFAYRKIHSKTLLFSLAGLFSVVLFVAAGISGRSSGGAAEEGLDASAQGRLYAWEAAFKMAVDNPLFGVGIDNFYSNYFYYSNHWDGLNHAVHSTWFGVLAETGFLGLAVFIWLIVKLFLSAKKSLLSIGAYQGWSCVRAKAIMFSSSESLLAGLAGTVVSGTFLTQGFTWPIYILTGLIVALARWVDVHCNKSA
ncbi:O-antigen ligase family protein [Agaribacterium haliotis]|uniref:O-antigen ligase family protein n=1 Tax=Agaribacterium haliotis TaxID=2013869 RepID=UPI000BB54A5D|nr:O-antigen ligase family protein [Agaribacterium haliotis]